MDIKISTELNPVFEILGLLYFYHSPKLTEQAHFVERAKELGLNGEELYKKFESLLDRYMTAFEKKQVLNAGDDFFFNDANEMDFLFLLQGICAEWPHWIEDIDRVPEGEIRETILQDFADHEADISANSSLSEIMDMLKVSGLSPNVCWKIMLLLQEPKKQLAHLMQIIKQNMPAYEAAVRAIEKPLKRRLDLFVKQKSNPLMNKTQELVMQLGMQKPEMIIPTLIFPAVDFVSGRYEFSGLFTSDAYEMIEKLRTARHNNPVIKALSDGSKFDILLSLNHSPKYNLELAEELGLTAATISHHMQALLAHNLVSVEKRDGRVYYTLVKEPIRDIITQLQSIFSL